MEAAAAERAPSTATARAQHQSEALSVTLDQIARRVSRGDTRVAAGNALSQRQLEEMRVRVELASLRSESVIGALPPSGREFDPVPDATEEVAYDALEKAYNLAFAVCPPERLKRAEEDERAKENRETEAPGMAMTSPTAGELSRVLVRKRHAIEHQELVCTQETSAHWTQQETIERQRSIDKMRNSRHQANLDPVQNGESQLHHKRSTAMLTPILSGPASVLEHAQRFASNRAERQKTLLFLAEACRSRVIGRSRMRNQADNGYIRTPAMSLTLQIPAQLNEDQQTRIQASPDDDVSCSTAPECKAVAEFLTAQLSMFAGSMSQGHLQTPEHRSASLASHQLRRDHQRTLTDFELNAIRSSERSAGIQVSSVKTISYTQNPFQRVSELFDSAWKSSLKRVEYGDWQLGSRGDPCGSLLRESNVSRELQSLYNRGLNAVLIHRSDGARNEVSSFFVQLQNLHTTGLAHVVVTEPRRIPDWCRAMSKQGILVAPRWGSQSDLDRPKSMGVLGGRKKGIPRVFVFGSDEIAEDLAAIALLPLHICVFDIECSPKGREDESQVSVWPRLLALQCRQRILLSPPGTALDVRELALFTYPAAFCSRRKILAWSCAAPSRRLVSSIIDAVNLCTICTDNDDKGIISDWNASLEKNTLSYAQRERRKLEVITRDVAASASADDRGSYLMNLAQPEVEISAVSVKKPRMVRHDLPSVVSIDNAKLQSIEASKLPRKRRRRSSKARKRISRCGDCAGCLAEDCMKCGHCEDMKKYGGPGLRKQSCKRRKCLNPKTWGLKRRRAGRHDDASFEAVLPKSIGVSSDEDYSDQDSLAETGELSSSSSEESEGDISVIRAGRTAPTYDSDSYESSHLGDEMFESNNGDLLDHGDDTDADDPASEGGTYSRAGRSRVMRCGKCRGCTSGDCMKCLHCQDMKKYGGPGLRKQSCKNRKCIAPKIVLLNQMRERHDAGGDDGTDSENPPAEDDLGATERFLDVDVSEVLLSSERLDTLHLVHECSLVVRKFQFFSCDTCRQAFTSQKILDQHSLACHGSDSNASSWEYEAELILLHPAHQLACLLASRRSINPSWQGPSVRAYAKLEGAGFEYFFFKPFAVLGRLPHSWSRFYEARGMSNRKGLASGSLDCHIGDDGMIASQHALIQWDQTSGFFTIECLSFRSSISVNGRDIHYSSHPLRLHSQDLIQIGATTAYFLLPKTESASSSTEPTLRRADVRAWLDASLTKRRARAAQDVAIQREIRRSQMATQP